MLQNKMALKKSLLGVLLCIFAAGLIFAQAAGATSSSSSDLTKRFLQKADDQYSAMQYEDAFKTINAALKLSEKDEIPGNGYLLATQIYTKLLEKMTKTKDYTYYNDVIMNLQTYPKINDDPKIQKFIRMLQQQQADAKDAARDAKNREMMQEFIWMSCGGLQMFNAELLAPLVNHKVVILPDTDETGEAYNKWLTVLKQAQRQYVFKYPLRISRLLEDHASAEQKKRKIDIIDFLYEQ